MTILITNNLGRDVAIDLSKGGWNAFINENNDSLVTINFNDGTFFTVSRMSYDGLIERMKESGEIIDARITEPNLDR